MTSIKKKARIAAGRARCSGCKFWNSKICVSPEVAQVCYENFIKGYLKGYNQRKIEEKGGLTNA